MFIIPTDSRVTLTVAGPDASADHTSTNGVIGWWSAGLRRLRLGISDSGSCEGAVPAAVAPKRRSGAPRRREAGAPLAVSRCALGNTDIRNLPGSIPGHVSSRE